MCGFPGGANGKEPVNTVVVRERAQSLDWENPLEEGIATYSRIFAWQATVRRAAQSCTTEATWRAHTGSIVGRGGSKVNFRSN